jgi:competence protein ComEC
VTLALNPRASWDPGWQLSFAAVLGIFLWARTLRELFERRLGSERWRRALADGLAVTVSATMATAPLMAHTFEAVSLTSLLANVLALPAVAPSMWLGMIGAALGQLPGFPVEPVNWANSVLLAYVAQVAAWLGRPGWALAGMHLRSWTAVAAAYAVLLAAGEGARRWAHAHRGMATGRPVLPRRGLALAGAAVALLIAVPALSAQPGGRERQPGLEVSVLDVGQGDAILLQPRGAGAILVDGGPHGDDLRRLLAEHGVTRLEAALLTHDQADHVGGIEEIIGRMPVRRLLYAEAGRSLLGEARSAGTVPVRIAEGSEIDEGQLRLEILWPPREVLDGAAGDPNLHALVVLARWHGFTMLLTADAEAESVPIDPGPVDVLKVAHHGSDDAGLGPLLDRIIPKLAVISVGAGNPYGHPTAGTLAALAGHEVPTLRTDEAGTVNLLVRRGGVRVEIGD